MNHEHFNMKDHGFVGHLVYRMILLIGLMYKSFGKYRKENMEYFEQTEREVIDWIS